MCSSDGTPQCAEILCNNDATHDFHDDMGAVTKVCDDHAEPFPEEMLEPLEVAP